MNAPLTELEIAERAAQRAATSVANNDARVRSGLLNETVVALQRDATSVLREAQSAYAAFATALVISEQMRSDHTISEALDFFDTSTLPVIHKALTEQALLGAYRLSDSPNGDRLTLCSLIRAINTSEAELKFATEDWALALGYSRAVIGSSAQTNSAILAKLRTLIPERWPSPDHDQHELAALRSSARSFRQNYLAHYIPADLVDLPTYADAGRLAALTLELASDVAMLVKGAVVAPDTYKQFAHDNAAKFWTAMLAGPKEKWRQHAMKLAEHTLAQGGRKPK